MFRRKISVNLCLLLVQLLFVSSLYAQEPILGCDCVRPGHHAPIGVMGDHTHKAGEAMVSYRYMRMDMDGLRDGSSNLSPQDVLQDFMVTPTDMEMDMHMFGGMVAPNDFVTFAVMIPYLELRMNHLVRNGRRFRTETSGLGDITLAGLVNLIDEDDHQLIFNAGLSLPSGDIDATDDTPAGEDVQLPYPMQLGSGTVDLKPGVTYLGQDGRVSWGAQGIGTIRLGRNDNDYSQGDRFDSTAWGAFVLSDWVSTSLRTSWSIWGNFDGADPALNPMMIPTADPDRRGGRRIDIAAGVNFYVPSGYVKGLRLAVEGILPVYENLDGPQLETDWSIVAGAQMSF